MKKIISALALAAALAAAVPAQAHGYGYGWRGGYWGGGWGVPLVTGAIVGAGIYASTHPYYYPYYNGTTVIYNQPATVYTEVPPAGSAPAAAPRIGYYCATSQQFYPNVATCQTPWQQVTLP
jgi:hypothetical protein